jgi:hypothetical protein
MCAHFGYSTGTGVGEASWPMANRWSAVTVDCADPRRVARFWSELLNRPEGQSESGWVYLGERGDAEPRLVFQPVPEPKRGKTR